MLLYVYVISLLQKLIKLTLKIIPVIQQTLANIVFPVPGGPYKSILRYKPLFDLVFAVDKATS